MIILIIIISNIIKIIKNKKLINKRNFIKSLT